MEEQEMKPGDNKEELSINLHALYSIIREKGSFLIRSALLAVILVFGVVLLLYVFQPKTFKTKAEFNLYISGISEDKYPDGSAFSPSDIMSLQVLTKVYRKNGLASAMSFNEFKNMISIAQTNDRISLADMEYAFKYYEPKLGLDEKMKLEELFRKKKEMLQKPRFVISMSEISCFESLVHVEKAKIIKDILDEYSQYITKLKGANPFQYAMLSTDILSELEGLEYQPLVHLDKVENIIDILLENIGYIKTIPGVALVRINEGITIFDLEYYIKHLQFNQLTPSAVLTKDILDSREMFYNINYIRIRLENLFLEDAKLEAEISYYIQSLFQYVKSSVPTMAPFDAQNVQQRTHIQDPSVMIPQFSASFVENIMELFKEEYDSMFIQQMIGKISSKSIDRAMVKNRIAKYNTLIKTLNEHNITLQSSPAALVQGASFLMTRDQIVDNLRNIILDISELYDKLQRLNARPEAMLYSMEKQPYSRTYLTYRASRLFLIAVLLLVFLLSVLVSAVLFLHSRG